MSISLAEYGVLEVTPHHHWPQTRNEKEPLKWNYFHNILFPPCSCNSKPFTLRCESTSVMRAFTWKSFPREMSFHLIPMVIAKCHHYTSYLSLFIQQLKERVSIQVHLLILLLYVFNHFEWSSSDNLRSKRPFCHLGTAAKAYLHLLRINVRITFWKGWLAIAKLKPLSPLISLFWYCQMLF